MFCSQPESLDFNFYSKFKWVIYNLHIHCDIFVVFELVASLKVVYY